jgi:hypothetical protein
MTHGLQLRHWSSPADPRARAVELLLNNAQGKAFSIAVGQLGRDIEDTAFLIVRVDEVDRAEILRAIDAFQRTSCSTRLCLAGTHSTLERLGSDPFDSDQVGWMLDDIDVTTPWSEIVSGHIEAIRFCPDFVARACRNMRLGLVLEATLLLARDLGLCALGSNDAPGVGGVFGRLEFDYMPIPPVRSMPAAARDGILRGSRSTHAITRGR